MIILHCLIFLQCPHYFHINIAPYLLTLSTTNDYQAPSTRHFARPGNPELNNVCAYVGIQASLSAWAFTLGVLFNKIFSFLPLPLDRCPPSIQSSKLVHPLSTVTMKRILTRVSILCTINTCQACAGHFMCFSSFNSCPKTRGRYSSYSHFIDDIKVQGLTST